MKEQQEAVEDKLQTESLALEQDLASLGIEVGMQIKARQGEKFSPLLCLSHSLPTSLAPTLAGEGGG